MERIYDQASYFTKTAALARKQTKTKRDEEDCQHLLVCRVLVGDFTEFTHGKSIFAAPLKYPEADIKKVTNWSSYHSVVNRVGNPEEFWTFDPDQAYPQFHVQYFLS